MAQATVAGLRSLRTPEEVAQLRGLSINQVLGLGGQEPEVATATLGDGEATDSAQTETAPAAEPAAVAVDGAGA